MLQGQKYLSKTRDKTLPGFEQKKVWNLSTPDSDVQIGVFGFNSAWQLRLKCHESVNVPKCSVPSGTFASGSEDTAWLTGAFSRYGSNLMRSYAQRAQNQAGSSAGSPQAAVETDMN